MTDKRDILNRQKRIIKNLKTFLDSNLTEMDYFQVEGENLITLKEYLIETRKKFLEYQSLIEEPLKQIQTKNSSIINIIPDYINEYLRLYILNYENIKEPLKVTKIEDLKMFIVDYDKDSLQFNTRLERYKFNRNLDKVNYLYDELDKIWEIANNFYFDFNISSVSKFLMYLMNYFYDENAGYIRLDISLPRVFDVRVQNDDVELIDRKEGFLNKDLISQIDKEKLLTKIFIPTKTK